MALKELKLGQSWESFLDYRSRRLHGIETGIGELDRLLLGLRGVSVVQGAPGSCKSTFAMNVALHQAKKGRPVLIIDRENGFNRYRERLICAANGVSSTEVMTAPVSQLKEWARPLHSLPIYLLTQAPTPQELQSLVAEMADAHSGDLFMVVDSLQKMPPIANDERLSLQQWMIVLDQLKLDYDGRLTMLVASEKSRGQGGANYDMASLSAAKGAGGIEYTAEIVLDMRQTKDGGLVLEVIKNRDGINNVAIDLAKALSDDGNNLSFTYKLEAA